MYTLVKQTVEDRTDNNIEITPADTVYGGGMHGTCGNHVLIDKWTHRESVGGCRVRDDRCARAVAQHHRG